MEGVKGINDLISYIGELGSTCRISLDDGVKAPIIEQIRNSIANFSLSNVVEGKTKIRSTHTLWGGRMGRLTFMGYRFDFRKILVNSWVSARQPFKTLAYLVPFYFKISGGKK